jgi:hypothetical protein
MNNHVLFNRIKMTCYYYYYYYYYYEQSLIFSVLRNRRSAQSYTDETFRREIRFASLNTENKE